MIPLRDEMPTRRVPYVNYALIAMNILVFVIQLMQGPNLDQFVQRYALIPLQVTTGFDLRDLGDIFSSMFMHAGLAHIGGNMLYLWIFGDNVEDATGHLGYLAFYLFGGVLASVTHLLTNPTSQVPTVGASGAIAAVLGAYMVLYPRSRVMTVIVLGYFIRLTMLPAALVLGLWFVLQFFEGVLSLGMAGDVGGVAFWAHIGGFAAGYVLARLFVRDRVPAPGVQW